MTVTLVVQADGRVLPDDPEAANQFPPNVDPVSEDPGPVPSADRRRFGDPNVVGSETTLPPLTPEPQAKKK